MTCRLCGAKARVDNISACSDHTIRYRECSDCGHRFATLEMDRDMWRSFCSMKSPAYAKRKVIEFLHNYFATDPQYYGIDTDHFAEEILHTLIYVKEDGYEM